MSTPTYAGMFKPPSGLTITVTNPNTNQPSPAFPAQTAAWVRMQNVVNAALLFPSSQSDFTNLYGDFSDMGTVETAVSILGQVNATSNKYGNPQTLISQINQFASSTNAPGSIYGNAVWLAAQTIATATQIIALLNEGLNMAKDDKDPQTRISDLSDLITQGIAPLAATLQTNIANFERKVSTFYTELNAELTGQTNSLNWYLSQSNNVVADAQSAYASDQQDIQDMTKSLHDLNKEYTKDVALACSSPAFLLIPFVGVPLAIADATVFGLKAEAVKKKIAAVKQQLTAKDQDEQKKGLLVTQVTHFQQAITDVDTDGQDFLSKIGALSTGWAQFPTQMNAALGKITVQDVQDWGAFMDKVEFKATQDLWKQIADVAQTFYSSGFASFSTSNS